jgi:DivIVA domain-containing protein
VPFTPEEIDSKEFLITLRGYDKDEVKAFLKAVAADYRAAVDSAAPPPEAPGNAYEALGKDIGQVLQVAKQSADHLKKKAEEEATSMRRRAEEEANTLRDAASGAANRLTQEAERHAVQVRAEAERDASERTTDANRRVEKLQSAESKLRQRLYALEMMLQSMRQELESGDSNGAGTSGDGSPALSSPTSKKSSTGTSAKEPPSPPSGEADRGGSEPLDLGDKSDREPLGGTSG